MARDQKKKEQCAKAGVILLHVPYWCVGLWGDEGGKQEE
jgi:hypothetical protein